MRAREKLDFNTAMNFDIVKDFTPREAFLYHLLVNGTLYIFFLFWSLFNCVTVLTLSKVLRCWLRGYKDTGEERMMRGYMKTGTVVKLGLFSVMVAAMDCYFLWFELTRGVFVVMAGVFGFGYMGLRMMRVDLIKLLG